MSSRGALALRRVAQAIGYLGARDFVTPDDIKSLAVSVLGHRVLPKGVDLGADADPGRRVFEDILARTPVPL
ncbi:MAG: hypothetical protein IPN23_11185 [Elusimicrobia bacterium]|nr:hypothetical protein [Elusimicrobiota bacterium]